ncbi:MAG: hypothetical protein KGL39_18830 [Patescibacteria group bacterium]|nr:hypothetical protein [Patescibacteria group bacterium]
MWAFLCVILWAIDSLKFVLFIAGLAVFRGVEFATTVCAVWAVFLCAIQCHFDPLEFVFILAVELISVWRRVGRWMRFHLSRISPSLYIGWFKQYSCRGYRSFAILPHPGDHEHAHIAAFLYHESDVVSCDDFEEFCGNSRVRFTIQFPRTRAKPGQEIRVDFRPYDEFMHITRSDGLFYVQDIILGDVSIDAILEHVDTITGSLSRRSGMGRSAD